MTRLVDRSLWAVWVALAVGTTCGLAQNLLTNNAGFEATTGYYSPNWGHPYGSLDAISGWRINLDPAADGWAGAVADQSPQGLEGTQFGYVLSGYGEAGSLETSPESRAPVDAGTAYTLWFLARGDSPWDQSLATVSLVWYVNKQNDTTQGDPTNLDLTLPMRTSTTDAMEPYHITAVAPQAAHYAGVRISRTPYDYNSILVDDFVIMPDPVQVTLAVKHSQTNAVLSWPRSLKHELEETDDLLVTNGWHKSNKPVKGLGAENYVEYPVGASPRFFRLAESN